MSCWESLHEDARSCCAAFLSARYLGRLFATSRGGRALIAHDAAWESVCNQYGIMPVAGLTPARGAALKRWVTAEFMGPPPPAWMDEFRRCHAPLTIHSDKPNIERQKPGLGLACDPGIAAALCANALKEWDDTVKDAVNGLCDASEDAIAANPTIQALADALKRECLESDARRRERGAPKIWAVVECVRNSFVINATTVGPARLHDWGCSEYGQRYDIVVCVRGELTLHFRGEFYHLHDIAATGHHNFPYFPHHGTGAHIIGELSVVEHDASPSARPGKKPRRQAAREAHRLLTSVVPAAPAGTAVPSPDVPQGAKRVIRFDCMYSEEEGLDAPPQPPRECDGAAFDALVARLVGAALPRAVGAELLWRLLCGPAIGGGLLGPDAAGPVEERMVPGRSYVALLHAPLRRVFPIHAITATGEEADAATGEALPIDALWPSCSEWDLFGGCEELALANHPRANDDFDTMKGSAEMCPGGCGLERMHTPVAEYICDACRAVLPLNAEVHACRACGWDVCRACWQAHQHKTRGPASRTRSGMRRALVDRHRLPVSNGVHHHGAVHGVHLMQIHGDLEAPNIWG